MPQRRPAIFRRSEIANFSGSGSTGAAFSQQAFGKMEQKQLKRLA